MRSTAQRGLPGACTFFTCQETSGIFTGLEHFSAVTAVSNIIVRKYPTNWCLQKHKCDILWLNCTLVLALRHNEFTIHGAVVTDRAVC